MTPLFRYFALASLVLLAACQDKPKEKAAAGQVKIGKPYVVDGKTYYPSYDPTYDKIGEASWYGPGFHGKYTANGEVFNQNDLTAAHPTLPMPSIVRVTNLENGKSIILRINDRGPFKSNRIIDLSKKSAEQLGIHSLCKVRVQFLKNETEEYIASITGKQKVNMASYNNKAEAAKNASIMRSTEPSQIVESTVATTHAGQVVTNAAPIVTVNSGELEAPEGSKTNLTDKSGQPVQTSGPSLVKQAWADDNVTMPAPPPVKADPQPGAFNPPSRISETAQPVELIETPEEKPIPKPPVIVNKPRPALAAAPENGWFIQAGSFAAEENARKLSSRLSSIGNVSVGKIDLADKIWWRVRLGPFSDQQEASLALDKVRGTGLADARIAHQ